MEPVKQIEVNGRKYAVKMFGPLEAFEFIHECVDAAKSGKGGGDLALRAIRRCVTPSGQDLGRDAAFEAHFAQHAEDLVELGHRAQEELVKPFFRKKPDAKAVPAN